MISGETNLKQILSEKTELDVKIQSIMKNGLVDLNDEHDISDSVENEVYLNLYLGRLGLKFSPLFLCSTEES